MIFQQPHTSSITACGDGTFGGGGGGCELFTTLIKVHLRLNPEIPGPGIRSGVRRHKASRIPRNLERERRPLTRGGPQRQRRGGERLLYPCAVLQSALTAHSIKRAFERENRVFATSEPLRKEHVLEDLFAADSRHFTEDNEVLLHRPPVVNGDFVRRHRCSDGDGTGIWEFVCQDGGRDGYGPKLGRHREVYIELGMG